MFEQGHFPPMPIWQKERLYFSQEHYPNIIGTLNALQALQVVHAYFTGQAYYSCQRNLYTVLCVAWQKTRLHKDIFAGLDIGLI